MQTRRLLETIGYPDGSQFVRTDREESQELYEIARENKAGSLYLHALAETGEITTLQEKKTERDSFHEKLEDTYRHLAEEIPDKVNYAAVKSVYPFAADFKDIDLLVFDDNLPLLKESLLANGFRLVSETPISFDVVDLETDVQVDVQTNLAVRRVVYLDKNTIEHTITRSSIAQSPISTVSPAADLAVIIAHSVIEQLYILKEFYYAVYALETMSSKQLQTFKQIVKQNNLKPACSAFFTITRKLSIEAFNEYPVALDHLLEVYGVADREVDSLTKSGYQLPHRYSRETGMLTVMHKFTNPTFVKTLVSELPHLLYPPTFFYLLGEVRTRFTRKHYAHEKRYE